MRPFIKNISFFLILFLTSFLILKITLPTRAKNYHSAFVDKLKILQSNKKIHKIILIGGSGVGWGISGELIEQETGIKTINLGHNAGFGLIDYQKFIMDNITKDDIIIFSPEWNFYNNPTFYDEATLNDLIINNLEYNILINNYYYVIKSLFTKIERNTQKVNDSSSAYRYDCFNKNGDIISHCGLIKSKIRRLGKISEELKIDSFKIYFKFLSTNRTFFLFPPTQSIFYKENFKTLNRIEKLLQKNNFKIIDNLENNVYSDEMFFDAEYHLKCEYKNIRTKKIIDYLKQTILIN
jgi:hypothetical protein